MTTIYFIRHAESDTSVRDGRIRPLTEKGLADRKLVTDFLHDKNIDIILSSPYKRAIDTVADFAEKNNLKIETIENFRERKSDSDWNRELDYDTFNKRQWDDFSYTLSDGECIAEVQERNITALNEVLDTYKNKTIVIGTHGMALSAIINHFDKTYGFDEFMAMLFINPWVVKMDFNENGCIGMEKIDLFNPVTKPNVEKCIVLTADLGSMKAYKYTVIFARYQNKWLYCRAKERDTFETAGGRIEEGETTLEAAKREFYEETGAVRYDITPVFDYAVHYPNIYANGQVFLAQVQELGDMPGYEMAEVKLFDSIPDKMRFPHILPVLFERVKITDILWQWGITDERISQIYKSAHNTTWSIGDAFILQQHLSPDADKLARNIRLANLLIKEGIQAVTYIKFTTDGAFSLTRKLMGEHIDFYEFPEMMVELGRGLARLHIALTNIEESLQYKDYDFVSEWNNYIKPGLVGVAAEIVTQIESDVIAIYPHLPRSPIHRDVHSQNVLFHEGEISGWLDFDLNRKDARIFDLAYLLAGLLVGRMDDSGQLSTWKTIYRNLLTGYNEIATLTASEIKVLPALMIAIELLFVTYWNNMGNDAEREKAHELAIWIHENSEGVSL